MSYHAKIPVRQAGHSASFSSRLASSLPGAIIACPAAARMTHADRGQAAGLDLSVLLLLRLRLPRGVVQAISERPEGYVIKGTGEVVAYSDARLKDSPDGEFHWCSVAGADDSRTICLFVPPRSY